jgi:hypothetical protein
VALGDVIEAGRQANRFAFVFTLEIDDAGGHHESAARSRSTCWSIARRISAARERSFALATDRSSSRVARSMKVWTWARRAVVFFSIVVSSVPGRGRTVAYRDNLVPDLVPT